MYRAVKRFKLVTLCEQLESVKDLDHGFQPLCEVYKKVGPTPHFLNLGLIRTKDSASMYIINFYPITTDVGIYFEKKGENKSKSRGEATVSLRLHQIILYVCEILRRPLEDTRNMPREKKKHYSRQ